MDAIDLTPFPVVDAHLHAPLREFPAKLGDYRWQWYEGRPEYAELVTGLTAYRWAMHELHAALGCDDTEAAVVAAIAAREPRHWLRETLERERVEGLVLDTGYPPPDSVFSPAELAEAGGVPVAPLLRIEHRAGELASSASSFAEFLEGFDAAVAGARGAGYAGLKSVIAYRSGLGVGRPGREQAEEAFGRETKSMARGSLRLTEKHLLDFLLVRSLETVRREELPFQLHTGYGDRDIDLRAANPLELRPLLESDEARGVSLVLLHGAYPYTREAAWLAAVYPNVYLDVATCIPPLGWSALVETWRVALAVAPLTRIHASSDAAGLVEHIGLGARRARATLGVALEELHRAGSLSAPEVEEAAAAILAGNARRLYFGAEH